MYGSAWCARITLEDAPLRPLDKYGWPTSKGTPKNHGLLSIGIPYGSTAISILENHLASMGTSKRKTPEVPKRYAKKTIKEWELEIELPAADPANDKNGGKDHEDNLNG